MPHVANTGARTEPAWYACHTRARAEKQVANLLVRRGIESYLPLVSRLRQWKDRKKLVSFPMFPGYVFARFALLDVHKVLATPGVSTIVKSGELPAAIAQAELNNVMRLAEALAGSGLEPESRPLAGPGSRVRVTAGPFQGIEGQVREQRGRRRLLVGIGVIGQAIEIEIGAALLEVVDPEASVLRSAGPRNG